MLMRSLLHRLFSKLASSDALATPAESTYFVACSCDESFALYTAVMLTSFELNGGTPEAQIIVIGFNLSDTSKAMLRSAAGRCNVRIVDATANMLPQVEDFSFTTEYPLSVLGRLLVADQVNIAGARVVALDSDMIINASLRPLFLQPFGDMYFAAIHDPPRINDLSYFNSGLIVFDVDTYKKYAVTERCLQWLADQDRKPHFPDQDALNHIVGHSWYRLARTWNYFCYNSAGFVPDDYTYCRVAHFAGPKPWRNADHPGRVIYEKYLNILRDRVATQSIKP